MVETISRQAAIERFDRIRPRDPMTSDYTHGIDVGIALCKVAIREQPLAQLGTNLAEVGTDCISRQQAIDATKKHYRAHDNDLLELIAFDIEQLPPIQPEPHEIGYDDCANALLKMWMDNVLTDGDYYRIADKLNKKWGKIELPEPYTEPFKGVTE